MESSTACGQATILKQKSQEGPRERTQILVLSLWWENRERQRVVPPYIFWFPSCSWSSLIGFNTLYLFKSNNKISQLKCALKSSCQTSIWRLEFLLYHFTRSASKIYLMILTEYLMKQHTSSENSALLETPSNVEMKSALLLASPTNSNLSIKKLCFRGHSEQLKLFIKNNFYMCIRPFFWEEGP